MKELLRRLFARPGIAAELIVASLFINVLAMASPLFVMQVLNRYVAYGVDATLVTLTTGVLIAIVLEFLFRQARLSLARGVSAEPDQRLSLDGFTILTRAKTSALDQIPPETRRELASGAQAIEQAYNANNVTTVLDVPFALLYVFVLYLIQPIIAAVVAVFLLAVFLYGVISGLQLQKKTAEMQQASGAGSSILSTATREGDMVRAFNAAGFLKDAWYKHIHDSQIMRGGVTAAQGLSQTVTQSATGLLSVAVIVTGALLVVAGEMDVGAMIGANILGARGLQPISKFSQLGGSFAKAKDSLELFDKLFTVPLEADSGTAVRNYSGSLEFRDMAFAFQGATSPLFESVSFKLEPGSVMVVAGDNGTGKTTLARLIMGLIEPIRGQVLVDGIDLKQVAPEWWRRQVIFQPQEPSLLNATIEQNLRVNNPDIELSDLNTIIDAVGLRKFLDESPDGFETMITENGWRLSEGIRRRMALARALATDAMLAVIDEPTESLDAEGSAAIHAILGSLAQRGRTIIIMSHDRNIVKGAHTVLDLNAKPVPELVEMTPNVVPVHGGEAAAPETEATGPAAEGDAEADDDKVGITGIESRYAIGSRGGEKT